MGGGGVVVPDLWKVRGGAALVALPRYCIKAPVTSGGETTGVLILRPLLVAAAAAGCAWFCLALDRGWERWEGGAWRRRATPPGTLVCYRCEGATQSVFMCLYILGEVVSV